MTSAAEATLKVIGGTFTTDTGTGTGFNAGMIALRNCATFLVEGNFVSQGTGLVSAAGSGSTIELMGGNIQGGKVAIGAGAALQAVGTNAESIAGPNILVNAGVVESSGTGGLTISDAVKNDRNANLFANGGNLTVTGAVTGSGTATIDGAVLDFESAANVHAMLTGSGTLKLGSAETFTGTVAGLGATDAVDLADFSFSNNPNITRITGTVAAGTTNTNVVVTDGALTVTLHLLNQYATTDSSNAPSSGVQT